MGQVNRQPNGSVQDWDKVRKSRYGVSEQPI